MSGYLHLSNSLIDLSQSISIVNLHTILKKFDERLRVELLKLNIRLMKIDDRLDELEGVEKKPVRRMKPVPATKCSICEEPAVIQLLGKWYCEEHMGRAW